MAKAPTAEMKVTPAVASAMSNSNGYAFRVGSSAVPPARPAPARAVISDDREGGSQLGGPELKILGALAWWKAIGVDRPTVPQLGGVAGYVQGGTFSTYLSRLTGAGLIERDRGLVWFTPAGEAAAPAVDAPTSLEELHSRIRATLDGPTDKIIEALLARGGEAMSTEELGQASGYAIGGTFSTYLSRLSGRGLIDRSKGMITPTEVLYPPALAVGVG
jgi:hypothetical protein